MRKDRSQESGVKKQKAESRRQKKGSEVKSQEPDLLETFVILIPQTREKDLALKV